MRRNSNLLLPLFLAALGCGLLAQLPKTSVGGGGGSAVKASTDLSDSSGLVRGAASLTTNNKLLEVSTTDGTIQEVSNQTANTIYAGPASGGAAAPGFRAAVVADIPAAVRTRSFGASFDGGGEALTTGKTVYTTIPYACTISAWNITVDTGTATVDIWKVATGTAIPTNGNSITSAATASTRPVL